jgi:threonyl-tRNA synthetase
LAVGQREVEEQTVAMRRLGSKNQRVLSLEEALAELGDEVRNRGRIS